MRKNVLDTGSKIFEAGFLYYFQIDWAKEAGTTWYRSKDTVNNLGRLPFPSYLMNKKWTLQEEFSLHMLRFQQVTLMQ